MLTFIPTEKFSSHSAIPNPCFWLDSNNMGENIVWVQILLHGSGICYIKHLLVKENKCSKLYIYHRSRGQTYFTIGSVATCPMCSK